MQIGCLDYKLVTVLIIILWLQSLTVYILTVQKAAHRSELQISFYDCHSGNVRCKSLLVYKMAEN